MPHLRTLVAPIALAAVCALSAPRAEAQTVAVAPTELTLHTLAATSPTPRETNKIQGMFSLRLVMQGGVSAAPQEGGAFGLQATIGSRVFFPTRSSRGWILGSDAGFDRTWGYGAGDASMLSLGYSFGHVWGLHGVAWAPRALYGWRDGGDTVWGVRNGVRMLVVGGIFDVEVAHQYVTGDQGSAHSVIFSLGMDIGLFGHVMAQFRAPQRS